MWKYFLQFSRVSFYFSLSFFCTAETFLFDAVYLFFLCFPFQWNKIIEDFFEINITESSACFPDSILWISVQHQPLFVFWINLCMVWDGGLVPFFVSISFPFSFPSSFFFPFLPASSLFPYFLLPSFPSTFFFFHFFLSFLLPILLSFVLSSILSFFLSSVLPLFLLSSPLPYFFSSFYPLSPPPFLLLWQTSLSSTNCWRIFSFSTLCLCGKLTIHLYNWDFTEK